MGIFPGFRVVLAGTIAWLSGAGRMPGGYVPAWRMGNGGGEEWKRRNGNLRW